MGFTFTSKAHQEFDAKLQKNAALERDLGERYEPLTIHHTSHRADADGLSGVYAGTRKFSLHGEFIGNDQLTVTGHRVMDFSTDETSDSYFGKVFTDFPADVYTFSDLPTTPVDDIYAKPELEGRLFMNDHHPVSANTYDTYLNPTQFGIDGGAELSSGMQEAYLTFYITEPSILASAPNVQTERRYRRDQALIVGVAGSKADQQEADSQGNKPMYDYLEKQGLLERINHTEYGHYSKSLLKSVAEKGTLHLRYSPLDANSLSDALAQGKSISDSARAQFIREHEGILLKRNSDKTIGVNQYLFEQADAQTQEQILFDIALITGKNDPIRDIGFSYDTLSDDFRGKLSREEPAKVFLEKLGINPDNTFAELSDLDLTRLKHEYRRNTRIFGDPDFKETLLAQIDGFQYGISDRSFIFGQQTIAELANKMTSASKMGAGDLFARIMDYVVLPGNTPDGEKLADLANFNSMHYHYMLATAIYMGIIEKKILDGGLETVSDDVHYFSLNALKHADVATHPDYKADVQTLTGVLGGLACSSRLLPNTYGTLLTGYELPGDEIKISARLNPRKGQVYHFGDMFAAAKAAGIVISGGGHPGAASTKLKKENIPRLFEFIRERGLQ